MSDKIKSGNDGHGTGEKGHGVTLSWCGNLVQARYGNCTEKSPYTWDHNHLGMLLSWRRTALTGVRGPPNDLQCSARLCGKYSPPFTTYSRLLLIHVRIDHLLGFLYSANRYNPSFFPLLRLHKSNLHSHHIFLHISDRPSSPSRENPRNPCSHISDTSFVECGIYRT